MGLIDPSGRQLVVGGGGGSLPTASSAGQVPVSSGAGTTYTAQSLPLATTLAPTTQAGLGSASGNAASLTLSLPASTVTDTWPHTPAVELAAARITPDSGDVAC